MCTNIIYRGDQINIGTKAEIYRSVGLVAKQINKGNPKYAERVGLLEAIRSHIKPESLSELEFMKRSSFI